MRVKPNEKPEFQTKDNFVYFRNQLSDCGGVGENLFQFCVLLFCIVDCVLGLQKLLSISRSYIVIVYLSVCATSVAFRKQSPIPISSRIPPTFSVDSLWMDL